MFRITSPKLLELFHTRTISQLWISAVQWHFNVNYRRPYLVVTFSGGFIIIVKCGPCDYYYYYLSCLQRSSLRELATLWTVSLRSVLLSVAHSSQPFDIHFRPICDIVRHICLVFQYLWFPTNSCELCLLHLNV